MANEIILSLMQTFNRFAIVLPLSDHFIISKRKEYQMYYTCFMIDRTYVNGKSIVRWKSFMEMVFAWRSS